MESEKESKVDFDPFLVKMLTSGNNKEKKESESKCFDTYVRTSLLMIVLGTKLKEKKRENAVIFKVNTPIG
jgi:hypothetical protein